jgi:hypothetical protein
MVGQVSSQFLATKLDGFGVEASDAGELADCGSVGVVGKRADIPASLGLGHTREQEVDLMVVTGKLRVGLSLAYVTFTVVEIWFWPGCHVVILGVEAGV